MHLVLFSHPAFLHSESMIRFAGMLEDEYTARGHTVERWAPQPWVYDRVPSGRLSKWAGYIDLFVLFPMQVRRALRSEPGDTLYVFCDQALGPWVPLVGRRPHVVHCHDLLALRSALGDVAENRTGFTGRIYQRFIRRGFRRARQFICISQKTREDLQRFGGVAVEATEVVYNGLNFPYHRLPPHEAAAALAAAGLPEEPRGMLLHVGNGAWYKNTAGLVRLYASYARAHADPLPLWLIMPAGRLAPDVEAALEQVPPQGRIERRSGVDSATLQAAYSLASAFLFPSLEEGFGWPLVEAQACGCPVMTTDAAPMSEVAGPHAHYLPRLRPGDDADAWAAAGAAQIDALLAVEAPERARRTQVAIDWAARFTARGAIEAYLAVYQRVLNEHRRAVAETPLVTRRGDRPA